MNDNGDILRDTAAHETTSEPLDFPVQRLQGEWDGVAIEGSGILRLEHGALTVVREQARTVTRYTELTGAGWQTTVVRLHGARGTIALHGDGSLDRAWPVLIARACPTPEFTRAWRAFRFRGDVGARAEAQSEFFAPFIHARRRLEDEPELDRRATAFQAAAVRDRVVAVLESFASAARSTSAADKRAWRAEIFDAAEPLFERFRALEQSESSFNRASESTRLVAWRHWVYRAAALFAEADRSWNELARWHPVLHSRGRSKAARRGKSALSVSMAAVIAHGLPVVA